MRQSLVRSWEQGSWRPGRGDLRLIQILKNRPQLIGELFAGTATAPSRPSRARRTRAVA